MSTPCTEIAFITLTQDADPRVKDSEAAKTLSQALTTQSQQPGFQRQWWGMVETEPHMLVVCVDWNSINDHERFMAADLYGPYLKKFNAIVGGPVNFIRVPFHDLLGAGTGAVNKFSTPFTEIDIVYFTLSKLNSETQASFSSQVHEFARKFQQLPDPASHMAAGWAVEEYEREGLGKGKEKPWVGIFGWESEEQHERAAKADVEKEYEHIWSGEDRELWHGMIKFQPG